MKNPKAIQQELRELQITLLADVQEFAHPSMHLPEEYFVELPDRVITAVREDGFSREMPMALPAGYFGQPLEQILALCRVDELPRAMPQEVPDRYFDELPGQMAPLLYPKPSLNLRAVRPWMPMSVAASVLFMLGIGFLMMGRPAQAGVEQELAMLSKAELEAYIHNHQTEFDSDLSADFPEEQDVDLQQLEHDVLDRALNEEDLQDFLL